MQPRIFVISLPEAKDRKVHVKKQLDALGLEFEFFDAVDGREFDVPNHPNYDRKRRLKAFGRDLKGGEMGCMLSHKNIYQKMLDENIEHAVVFEDDVIIEDEFKHVLDSLIDCKVDYELVRFLGSEKVAKLKQRKVEELINGFSLNRLMTTPGGAHAYLITKSGASKMLNHMDKVYLPVDTLMGYTWLTKIGAFIVQPRLAEQEMSFDNFIGKERFDKSLQIVGIDKCLFPLSRAIFKFSEAINKRLEYFKLGFSDRGLKNN